VLFEHEGKDSTMERKWWTLLVVALATFMLLLDVTIVNVALPSMERSLHASFNDLQWVVDAYALTLAAALLVSGSVADLIGRRRVFVVGLALFSAASLLCGLAQSPTMLSVSRAVQGIGGAMMFATTLALIAQVFQGADRAVAFGILGAVTGASVAIGPLLGGVLTAGLTWRSIFFVNVPIGVIAILVTLRFVHESKDPSPHGVDWWGASAFSGALALIVFALIRVQADGWTSTLILSCLIVSIILLGAFVVIERRHKNPLFDLSLFRKPAFCGVSTTAFVIASAMFAMFLYITLYLQNLLGYSALKAGVVFLPITVVSFFVAPVAGRLSHRVPARLFLSVGLLLIGIGLGLMAHVGKDSTWTVLLPGFLVAGVGIGMINPPMASAAIGVAPPQRSGMASGLNSTFRMVGLATGIAVLGIVFQDRIESKIELLLRGTPLSGASVQIAQAVATGAGAAARPGASAQSRALVDSVVRQAFTSTLNELFVIGAVVAAVGAVVAAITIRPKDFVVTRGAHPGPEVGVAL
jgi:EmrB/QacA subfamily drug resistance transporter